MYLKELLVENVGPVNYFDVSLPFYANGMPKPIVLVGKNGSGKSIILSSVADALIELAKIAYDDIKAIHPLNANPYFRIVGGASQKSNTLFGISLLKFEDGNKEWFYVEKSGSLEDKSYAPKMRGRFNPVQTWAHVGSHKAVVVEKDIVGDTFKNGAYCYFPASRHERPHWLNKEGYTEQIIFDVRGTTEKFAGRLDKSIVVESSAERNKQWILDVFLDAMVNIVQTPQGYAITDNMQNKGIFQRSRNNVELLLKHVMQDFEAKFVLSYRNISPYRLSISTSGNVVIPSLDNLSSGQAILFNQFATIIRYAESNNLSNSILLQETQGIVLIDEVDAHLHSDLQHDLLPTLIRLFPKVQFIISSHSPLFLLGMERQFGRDGFQIIDMPSGITISTERFSEFEQSFQYYQQTKAFEDTLKTRMSDQGKPIVLTEGELDPIYIRAALELLGHAELLESIEIDQVGMDGKSGPINAGHTGLDHTFNVILANPEIVNRKILLLYDCDTNKPAKDVNNLSIRMIPKNLGNEIVDEGIENLFAPELFQEQFYDTKTRKGKYGGETITKEFKKRDFSRWICEQRREVTDFVNFESVVKILQDFLISKSGEASLSTTT